MDARFFSTLAGAVALAVGLPTSPLAAQTPPDTTRLTDLVVTATRTPQPARVLGSASDVLGPLELARRQLGSLREALRLVPGTALTVSGGPGGVASVFIRGVASGQTLYLVDGIRINDANASAGVFLGGADLAGLGRLEVVRGPQSTLYGGAAIGGVVSLEAPAGDGPSRWHAEGEGGSFATWRGALHGVGRHGRLGFSAAVVAGDTRNERRPNAWDQRGETLRLDWHASDRVRVVGTFRGLQSTYVSPGDLRTTNTTPEGTTTYEQTLGTAFGEAQLTHRWRSRLTLGIQEQFTRGSGRFDGGPEFIFRLTNTRQVADWQHTMAAGPAELVAGANAEWSTARTDEGDEDERLLGAYGQAQVAVAPNLRLTAGFRADDYTTFGSAVTGRVTAAWLLPGSGTKFRASYGTGFMPPSLDARYGSTFQEPNPEIRPERSRGWDAGVDQYLADGGQLSATVFRNSLRDLVAFESAPFPALGRSVNVDRARTTGLELSGRLVSGPADARLAYTLLSARSESEPDPALRRLIRRPRHTLAADLALAASSRATLGAGVLMVAAREDADFASFPSARVDPGDYGVVRLYGSWDLLPRLRLRARVENLFDERYEEIYGFPALGRSVIGGVTVTW